MKQVLVVEDDAQLRTSMQQLLHICGYAAQSFSSGQALIDFLQHQPSGHWQDSAVVLDVHLDGDNGLEAQSTLRDLGIDVPVVFISALQDARDVNRAWREGASNFLFKPFTPVELLSAVEHAFATRAAADDATTALAETPDVDLRTRQMFERLTPRQRQVLQGVASGLSNPQISQQLGISARTVKMHREAMMHRFGFKHVTDLVRFHDACQSWF